MFKGLFSVGKIGLFSFDDFSIYGLFRLAFLVLPISLCMVCSGIGV